MKASDTILLTRNDIKSLLSHEECITAVEHAFKQFGEGKIAPPAISGIQVENGGFHIKSATGKGHSNYFAAKINANFPGNPSQYGIPSIQGVIVLCDADNGKLLALMDSMEITIMRTGAATAVATKWLSKPDSKSLSICGCGNQGRISLQMIRKVRAIEKVFAFDTDRACAERFAKDFERQLTITVINVNELPTTLLNSDIIVTCTPSREPFVNRENIMPGSFIAAVGADSENKQELEAGLVSSAKLVVDSKSQCAQIGELHHALSKGLMTVENVYAELGEIVCGKKQGRNTRAEIIIFDSTGTALQDVVSASIVYEKAIERGRVRTINLGELGDENVWGNTDKINALKSFYPFR